MDVSAETVRTIVEEWSKIATAVSNDGNIIFACTDEKPTTSIPIQIEVHR